MLKIKDNVDLKELEKYGFIEEEDFGTINYVIYKQEWELRISNSKYLTINCECEHFLSVDVPEFIMNIFYKLIKDGLVEKV